MHESLDTYITRSTTQSDFLKYSGIGSVIFVNPSKCDLHFGSHYQRTGFIRKFLKKALPRKAGKICRDRISRTFETFVITESSMNKAVPIDSVAKYMKVYDFIDNIENPDRSLWFKQLIHDLRKYGFAKHKNNLMRNRDEILEFLNWYAKNVVLDLKQNGFIEARTGYEATAIITKDGKIGKTGSGNHRFAISRALHIPIYPLKIVGVHQGWYEKQLEKHGNLTLEKTLKSLRILEESFNEPAGTSSF